MTVKQIKKELEKYKVSYPSRGKRDKLLSMLKETIQQESSST